jgi:hypothetical protein
MHGTQMNTDSFRRFRQKRSQQLDKLRDENSRNEPYPLHKYLAIFVSKCITLSNDGRPRYLRTGAFESL